MANRVALLFDGPEDGARAMARDEVLVHVLAGRTDLRYVFRAHGWLQPTLSIGRGQPVPPDLVQDAEASGVDLVRRPTGGGWLLHAPGDLALTLAGRGPLGPGELRAGARSVARAIARGLVDCGRPALVFTGTLMPASRSDICFMRADRDEVVVGATKVAGVALARLGNAVLVQSAVPLVHGPPRLAAFAERWDPRREEAVAETAGADREQLWRGGVIALGQMLGAVPHPWEWPVEALDQGEQFRARKYRDRGFTIENRLPGGAPGAPGRSHA